MTFDESQKDASRQIGRFTRSRCQESHLIKFQSAWSNLLEVLTPFQNSRWLGYPCDFCNSITKEYCEEPIKKFLDMHSEDARILIMAHAKSAMWNSLEEFGLPPTPAQLEIYALFVAKNSLGRLSTRYSGRHRSPIWDSLHNELNEELSVAIREWNVAAEDMLYDMVFPDSKIVGW